MENPNLLNAPFSETAYLFLKADQDWRLRELEALKDASFPINTIIAVPPVCEVPRDIKEEPRVCPRCKNRRPNAPSHRRRKAKRDSYRLVEHS